MSVSFPIFQQRIGRKLGVLAVSDALEAEDADLIVEKCISLQAQLQALGILNIDFDDGVDDVYADVLVDMAAALLVDDFMLPEPKRSQLAGEGVLGLPNASVAERRLRKLIAPFVTPGQTTRAQYF